MAESDLTESLSKKGPMNLPIGVWVVIGAGGLYFAYRTYKTNSATPSTATTGTTGNGTVDASGMGTYTPVGGDTGTASTGSSSTTPSYADNNAWASAAISYLVGLGYDAGLVNQAIGLYLASQPIPTTQMQAFINTAIQHLGPPPQTVAPVNGGVPPVQGGSGAGTATAAPGAITNVVPHVFIGTTNITWDNPKGTDYVKIGATAQGKSWGTVYTDVPTIGITGATGHLFVVDSISRGVTYDYTLTPYNSAGAGPTAKITVKNL
jgi:hypothetical protein